MVVTIAERIATYKVLIRNLKIKFRQQGKRWTTDQALKLVHYQKELRELEKKQLTLGPNAKVRGCIVL